MRNRPWTHYAAPAAFLLAVTVAVMLIRSAIAPEPTPTTTPSVPLLPRRTVATTTKPPPTRPAARPRFYTVVAGDTFAVISSKTGVPVTRLRQLNPNVNPTALFVGQRLRIR